MVDRTDLDEVNNLYAELANLAAAVDILHQGGRIVAFTVQLDLPESGRWVGVPSADIEYPAQMTQAIITAIEARQDAIQRRLEELGLTGVEAQPRKAK